MLSLLIKLQSLESSSFGSKDAARDRRRLIADSTKSTNGTALPSHEASTLIYFPSAYQMIIERHLLQLLLSG